MRDKKLISFLVVTALFFLVSCSGGGGGQSTPASNLARVTIDGGGNLSFTGSGDFQNLSINGSGLAAAAGGTLEIKKEESPSLAGDYIPAGFTFELTQYDKAGNKVTSPSGAYVITLPYNSAVLQTQGVDVSALVVVSLEGGGAVSLSGTAVAGKSVITASADATRTRLAAAYKILPLPTPDAPLPLLSLAFEGYAAALTDADHAAFTDKAGNKSPDRVRGSAVVQMGERVVFDALTQDVQGFNYASYNWTIVAKPGSSGATLKTVTGNPARVELIPDLAGQYTVTVTAQRQNGASDTASLMITAASYSSAVIGGQPVPFCEACHGGNLLPQHDDILDMYGRKKLRNLVTPWQGSLHGTTFSRVKTSTNSLCFNCHTTGFFIADRNRDGVDDFPGVKGYDDFMITAADWATPAVDRGNAHQRGVACEACHGPGGSNTNHDFKASLSAGPCLSCHDIPADIISSAGGGPHFSEFGDQHFNSNKIGGGIVSKNEPCFQCHVGQAFLSRVIAGVKLSPSDVKEPSGVTCAVCHEPHGESANPFSLRVVGNATLKADGVSVTVNAGLSAACYNCHNANNSLPNVGVDVRGNESEMLEGLGGYVYGDTSPATSTHGSRVANKCVSCHMVAAKGITHIRKLINNGVYNTAGCTTAGCHDGTGAQPLPTSGDNFDYKGKRTEIQGLLTQLQARINALADYPADALIKSSYAPKLSGDKLTAVNRAAYNYLFVFRDGSFGVHNYPYAKKLLNLSITDLQGY